MLCNGIASFGRIRCCNVLAACGVLVICKLQSQNFVKRVSVDNIAHKPPLVDEHDFPPTGFAVA